MKPRQRGEPATAPPLTFDEFADRYLQAHAPKVEASTLRTLEHRLSYARPAFGNVPLTDLQHMAHEIAVWRQRLPQGSAYGITAALRQTLQAAVDWRYIATNPAKDAGPNPQPKRAEIEPFTLAEIDRLAVELGPWRPFPTVAAPRPPSLPQPPDHGRGCCCRCPGQAKQPAPAPVGKRPLAGLACAAFRARSSPDVPQCLRQGFFARASSVRL